MYVVNILCNNQQCNRYLTDHYFACDIIAFTFSLWFSLQESTNLFVGNKRYFKKLSLSTFYSVKFNYHKPCTGVHKDAYPHDKLSHKIQANSCTYSMKLCAANNIELLKNDLYEFLIQITF
jgi:hypothetical protein